MPGTEENDDRRHNGDKDGYETGTQLSRSGTLAIGVRRAIRAKRGASGYGLTGDHKANGA